jgi:hypothetical protein
MLVDQSSSNCSECPREFEGFAILPLLWRRNVHTWHRRAPTELVRRRLIRTLAARVLAGERFPRPSPTAAFVLGSSWPSNLATPLQNGSVAAPTPQLVDLAQTRSSSSRRYLAAARATRPPERVSAIVSRAHPVGISCAGSHRPC